MAFDPTKLGSQYTYRVTNFTTGAVNTVRQLIQANSYRVAFLISPASASVLGFTSAVTPQTGIVVSNQFFTLFSLSTMGPLVQQEFWITSAAATFPVNVVEVLWIPPGE